MTSVGGVKDWREPWVDVGASSTWGIEVTSLVVAGSSLLRRRMEKEASIWSTSTVLTPLILL